MAKEYLDKAGLTYLWSKIKSYIDTKGSGATLDQIYPVNSIVCVSKNVNPSDKFGGTWELVDKHFKNISVSSGIWTRNTTNVTEITRQYAYLRDHMIRIVVSYTNKVALGENNLDLATLNTNAIGIDMQSSFLVRYMPGLSDDGNAIVMNTVNDSGVMRHLDTIAKSSATNVAAGKTIHIDYIMQVSPSNMMDSFCDKFFFKRTA